MKILFSLPLFACVSLCAQDPQLTQYNAMPVVLNPAFAGSSGCARAAAAYRMQWPGIAGNYNTLHVSYDQYIPKLKGGIGVLYTNDRAGNGTLKTNSAMLVYAPHFALGKNIVLKPALSAGVITKSVNWAHLNFGDMIDPRHGFVNNTTFAPPEHETVTQPDFGAGLVMYSSHLFGGFVVQHLFEPDQSFYEGARAPLPRKYTAHLGGIIRPGSDKTSEGLQFTPHLLLQQQGTSQMLLGGIAAGWKKFSLGVAYRSEDAIIGSLGFRNNLFAVAYSYDYTVSRLTNYTGGTHELTTSFRFGCKNNKELIRTLDVLPGI
jgi:type IX secretion system PorP/SprF family membrane protein